MRSDLGTALSLGSPPKLSLACEPRGPLFSPASMASKKCQLPRTANVPLKPEPAPDLEQHALRAGPPAAAAPLAEICTRAGVKSDTAGPFHSDMPVF
jgi:hypothetical protein